MVAPGNVVAGLDEELSHAPGPGKAVRLDDEGGFPGQMGAAQREEAVVVAQIQGPAVFLGSGRRLRRPLSHTILRKMDAGAPDEYVHPLRSQTTLRVLSNALLASVTASFVPPVR